MDALELLKNDHQRIRDLFNRFESSSDAQKPRVLEDIRMELDLHTFMEETVFYPFFRKFDEFKDLLEKSYQDHEKVRELLKRISGPKSDLSELRRSVEDHVSMEEGDFFPRVRKMMRRPEREQLGRHMQASRDEHAIAA